MSVVSELLLVEQATVETGEATPGSFPTTILYDGSQMEWRRTWVVPSGFVSFDNFELMIARQFIGSLSLNFKCIRIDATNPAAPDEVETGFANYAVALDDGDYEFVEAPASLFTGIEPNEGDVIVFVVQRAAVDTYNADLVLSGYRLSYDKSTPSTVGPEYCTQGDLEARISQKILAQLTNDTANATTPDADVVDFLIGKAGYDIDSYLRNAYDLPLATIPGIIAQIAIDLTCYYAMKRRFTETAVPAEWIATKDKAFEKLKAIAEGKIALPDISRTVAMMQMTANDKQFDFYNDDSPTSFY